MSAEPIRFVPDNLSGIGWLLLSVLVSGVMALGVRALSEVLDPRLIVFYRSTLTLLFLVIILAASLQWRQKLKITRPVLHLIRGVSIGVSTHLGFIAIARIELVTVTVLFFSAPIFATLLAIPVHREIPGPRRIAAVLIGFLGVLVVLRPDLGTIDINMVYALASSVLFALALVLSREVAEADGSFSVFVTATALTVLVSVPLALPRFALPNSEFALWMLALVVISGAIRSISDIQAYRKGEAAILAPITYLRLVVVALGAYFIFGEIPDNTALIGAAIIIAAALYIAYRERRWKSQSPRT